MSIDLKVLIRETGKVAPFINDWNVWDIPAKEWTPAVQRAILSAYELGNRHARESIRDQLYSADLIMPDSFPEPRDVRPKQRKVKKV